MLEILAKGFSAAKAAVTGRTTLTAENIDAALRAIRVSLLEADVELGVVSTFLGRVKRGALGEVVQLAAGQGSQKRAAAPGDHFVRICHRELVRLMGPVEERPIAFRRPLTTIMLVGLQGAGKTTTCGKLASTLLADRRRPLLVAADIYRPAAVTQLQVLGERLGVPVFTQPGVAPPELCAAALSEARRLRRDVVIFDTAGRLAIDAPLMAELSAIKARTRPDNVFLVCDAMAGQDTVRTAQSFDAQLALSGVIMTKLDGDARGGAALAIKEVTGRPIKYLGTGEGLDRLERFRPEGLASRILGMGDIVGLMEDFEQVVDEKQAERDAKKLLRGQFTLDDFLTQLRAIKKMGSIKDVLAKLPGMGEAGAPSVDDKMLVVIESTIQSMTPHERRVPDCIDASRTARIARGAGRRPEQVTELLGRFAMSRKMMAQLGQQPGLMGQLGRAGGGRGRPGGGATLMPGMPGMPGIPGTPKMPGMPKMPGTAGMPRIPGMAGMPKMPGMPQMPDGAGAAAGGRPGLLGGLGPSAPIGAAPASGPGPATDDMGLPPGVTPAQMAAYQAQMGAGGGGQRAGVRTVNAKQRQKARAKGKAARQARKRGR